MSRRSLAVRLTGSLAASFAILAPVPATAQQEGGLRLAETVRYAEMRAQAEVLANEGSIESAIALLETLTTMQSDDGSAWLFLANAHRAVSNCAAAAAADSVAINLGWADPATRLYRQARCAAQGGDATAAARLLESALDAGYRFRPRLAVDEGLEPLRDHPDFARLAGMLTEAVDREAGWLFDLAFLEAEVRRTHYRFRREALPVAFDQLRRELEMSIRERSDSEMVIGIQRLLATLGDGHTLAYPFGMRVGSMKRVPVTLYWFADGLFIINAAEDLQHLIGARVVRWGGLSPDALLEGLEELASHDNASGLRWVAPTYVTFPEFVRELGGAATADGVGLEYSLNGESQTVELTAFDVDPSNVEVGLVLPPDDVVPPRYLARVAENFWFEDVDRGVAYVQVNRVLNGRSESLDEFALRLRDRLHQGDVRQVVVDLRHNSGGEGSLLTELVRTLVAFDASGDGDLFVIIGRNTFSAAQTLIGHLDVLTNAVFVGEPSGSKPNRVGDEAQFVLPYSGVIGQIASGYHQTASKDERIWIAPQVPIALYSADYFGGRDPAMAAVAEWIARGLPTGR